MKLQFVECDDYPGSIVEKSVFTAQVGRLEVEGTFRWKYYSGSEAD